MSKIMLVEDDNSLREIYEARLIAEGYSVVSAKDGEEALAVALKERPDLIIADVMMPKVSGFDMLDILRSTPETKNTKIIMMTALSQAEDKARAEKLGADRYLVKSQVTLEDVTREARSILDELDKQAAATVAKVEGEPATSPNSTANTPPVTPPKPTTPPAPQPEPEPEPAPATEPEPPAMPTPDPVPATPPSSPKPTVTSIPVTAAPDDDDASSDADDSTLEAKAKSLGTPAKKEKAEVKEQVDEFIASNPTLSTSPEPQQQTATDAVNSLTKSPGSSATKDEAPGRAYVGTDDSDTKPSSSLEHTKTIKPTPESERASGKPDLDALLAQEREVAGNQNTPEVNSVITPSSSGETPPSS